MPQTSHFDGMTRFTPFRQALAGSHFGLTLACFLASSLAMQVLILPWGTVLLLILLGGMSLEPASTARRFPGPLASLIGGGGVCIAMTLFQPAIAALLLACWFFVRSRSGDSEQSEIWKHFARSVCLFQALQLLVLDHGLVRLILFDVSHEATRLFRHAIGNGEIVGPELLNLKFLSFSLITVLLAGGLRGGILQAGIVAGTLGFRFWLGNSWTLGIATFFAVLITARSFPATHRNHRPLWHQTQWGLRPTVPGIMIATCLALLAAAEAVPWFQAEASPSAASILFVNDREAREGDDQDMTVFENQRSSSLTEFERARTRPQYDKLAVRLLPALGYDVAIKDLQDLGPEDYSRHRLVVLICLQHVLPAEHKKALLEAIESGHTNLVIAGDHTDIHGVQGPFNDVMAPLGVTLNYDSVFPFGQWQSQLNYARHPINGPLSLLPVGRGGESGFSVGGSLTLAKGKAWPILAAADGFADQGTPNAPMYAGLGDSIYTPNETRGGLVVAAERPFGRGTILALGDTALLQNSSLTHNFAYLASIFDYMTSSARHGSSVFWHITSLLAGVILAGTLFWTRSARGAVGAIVVTLAGVHASSMLQTERDVIESLKGPLTIIDTGHGEMTRSHHEDWSHRALEGLLERKPQSLVLATNAWHCLPTRTVSSIVLLAPRGALSRREQDQLIQFVQEGGKLLMSAGYYEAMPHSNWLAQFECEITPLVLGAGQQIQVEDSKYHGPPRVSETWALRLGSQWNPAVTCFRSPVIASRQFGRGRVGIVADSFAMLDGTMQTGRLVNLESYRFFADWFDDLQI